MTDDTPRMWVDNEPKYDPETGEIIEDTPEQSDIIPVEDIPLPTTAEQSEIIAKSELSEDNKKLLNSIVELNAISDVLQQTYLSETQEKQKQAIQMICTNFLAQRFRNNQTAEHLKQALLTRLLNNIENLEWVTPKENTKYAFRLAAKSSFPKIAFDRPKLGFPVPIRVWLKKKRYFDVVFLSIIFIILG